jgi:hypothetical protein
MMESLKDVGASLVADRQPSEAAEPGQGSFDHPAMPSQALAALDAAPGNTRLDRTPAQRLLALRKVVTLVDPPPAKWSALRYGS